MRLMGRKLRAKMNAEIVTLVDWQEYAFGVRTEFVNIITFHLTRVKSLASLRTDYIILVRCSILKLL